MNTGYLILAEDGTINLLNEAASELLDVKVEQMVGRHWSASLDQAEAAGLEILQRAVKQVQLAEKPVVNGFLALKGRQKAGNAALSLRWTVSALSGGGSKRCIYLVIRGIPWSTPSVAFDIDVQTYQDFWENSVEGMFRSSLDGSFIEVNPALAKMYGFRSPAELISSLRDLNTQLYVAWNRRAEFVSLLATRGAVEQFESEIYRADGGRMWIAEYARTVYAGNGSPLYYEGSVTDISARHEAEERLRESEQRHRLLVEAMHLLPWEADLYLRQNRYIGPQAVEFLGFAAEECLAQNFWLARVHPDDRERVELLRADNLLNGESCEVEYRMMRADGRAIWVRDMMRIAMVHGEKTLIGCMLDVTSRRMTEASLEQSHYFFEQVVGASPVILYVYELETRRCIYLNERAGEVLGYASEALRQMDPLFLASLAHPEEMSAHEEHFQKVANCSRDEVLENEFRIRGADGNWIWLLVRESAFLPSYGLESRQIIGTATDCTVQRLAFDQLVHDELFFRSIIETARVIAFEYDLRADRFSYIGPQVSALLGYPVNRWYGQGFWASIVHPEDYKAGLTFAARESDHSNFGMGQPIEYRLLRANGQYLWVTHAVRRMADDDDNARIRGFLFDITETKRREEEIQQSRLLLRQLALKSESAREEERIVIARELHDELGQSLTLSQIEIQWLESRFQKVCPEDKEIEQKLGEMKKRTGETLAAVRRLLIRLRPPILDELGLRAAIRWQADEFSRRAFIRCELELDPIECDNNKISTVVFRVFQETLTNIAKHASATSVRVRMMHRSNYLSLTVSDNGQGFRVSEKSGKGGFGLLGMRERVEALEGYFEISSTLGKGTIVEILIPLSATA